MSALNPESKILQLTSFAHYEDASRHAIALPWNAGGELVPIGPWIFTRPEIVRAMTKWRADSRTMFFAQFPESVQSMNEFLSTTKVRTGKSVLFLIEGEQHELLGHVGLKSICSGAAEIDLVMRNSNVQKPRLMRVALNELIRWSSRVLHIRRLSLSVVSYNTRAIELYSFLGFKCVAEIPLLRVNQNGIVSHHPTSPDTANVDYQCIVMERHLESSP